MRATMLIVGLAVAAVGAQAPAPQIQNGKVEVRKGTAIDREIAALSPARPDEPVWVAWRAPMIDGDRDMCSWNNDMRGWYMDEGNVVIVNGATMSERKPIAPPAGPTRLEGGTQVVVLARIVDRKIERLRTIGDDCPMDAGGRTVYWLDSVTPADSLRFLNTLVSVPERGFSEFERTLAQNAVRAIGYHKDTGADAALNQIATAHTDSNVRRSAVSALGNHRGAAGVAALSKLIAAEKNVDARRQLVTSLGASRDASAVPALRSLMKDPEVKIRSEAMYYAVIRGGSSMIPEAVTIANSDPDDAIRKRAVQAIGRLAPEASVAPLLQLARTSQNAVVRKEAVSILSTSKDPRAMAYMDELLKK